MVGTISFVVLRIYIDTSNMKIATYFILLYCRIPMLFFIFRKILSVVKSKN